MGPWSLVSRLETAFLLRVAHVFGFVVWPGGVGPSHQPPIPAPTTPQSATNPRFLHLRPGPRGRRGWGLRHPVRPRTARRAVPVAPGVVVRACGGAGGAGVRGQCEGGGRGLGGGGAIPRGGGWKKNCVPHPPSGRWLRRKNCMPFPGIFFHPPHPPLGQFRGGTWSRMPKRSPTLSPRTARRSGPARPTHRPSDCPLGTALS